MKTVRKAQRDDVSEMVALAEKRRLVYQTYQPTFWRKAKNSREVQVHYFEKLLANDGVIALVHESGGSIDGFVITSMVPAPPVYDPGGLTCLIDDFCVSQASDWQENGVALLAEALQQAKERGAVQAVVVCGHLDEPKRAMLRAQRFTIASEWYVRDI